MVENKKSFRDELVIMAEISDLIQESDILPNDGLKVDIYLDKEKYDYILKNFRDIDKSSQSFSIDLENIKFNFFLKK